MDLRDSAVEAYENHENLGRKKFKEAINSWTQRPYSQRYYDILAKRKTLPAFEAREQLCLLLKDHNVIVLQGETGSGKTTQIPQFLLESEFFAKG